MPGARTVAKSHKLRAKPVQAAEPRETRDILSRSKSQILIVDDDRHIREVVRFALEQAGHAVREADDGAQARKAVAEHEPDLIVLDIVMPGEDGLSACRAIRSKSRVPIIFLSSRDEELDRVLGLELGGDDYLTKPFSPRELVARVAAVLRRTTGADAAGAATIEHGPLSMDLVRHRCAWHGREITLTVSEFALLRALLSAPGRVFERAQLVEQAYGHGHFVADRTVDSHIRRLRKKLADAGVDAVETVYGVGYRMREQLA
jgi:two-component system OmpR family response regulator